RPISIVAAKFSAANCGCAPTKARSSSWHDAPPGGFVIDDRAMKTEAREPAAARAPLFLPFYYGWFVVALSFLANLTAAGIRSAPSVLIHPLEAEFGWSRTAIASAASLNLLLLGIFAPVGGWLIDRIGARRVILGCLSTIALGLLGVVLIQELWQLILLWGLVLGIATGVTPALGASIASRWFVARRGLAIGIMTNANAAGQVIYLPLLMALVVGSGWRTALLAMAGASALLLPLIWLWMRDDPRQVGLEPYRAAPCGRCRWPRFRKFFARRFSGPSPAVFSSAA